MCRGQEHEQALDAEVPTPESASLRIRPLKLSVKAFWVALPGAM
jgi:hypothetical protein